MLADTEVFRASCVICYLTTFEGKIHPIGVVRCLVSFFYIAVKSWTNVDDMYSIRYNAQQLQRRLVAEKI